MGAGGPVEITKRTVVEPDKKGLSLIATFSGAMFLVWLFIALSSIAVGDFSEWIVLPVGGACAILFGWICWWSIHRRANDEPALIIDEVGLFDNVSMVHAGRLKWRHMERLWLAGPRWMQFICVRPDNPAAYAESQHDFRRLLMVASTAVFGAPVVIPVAVLDLEIDRVWSSITAVAGGSSSTYSGSRFVTGA